MGKRHKINNRGYVALISVLIMEAIGLVVSVSMILLGLGFSRTSYTLQETSEARAIADACAEKILQEIYNDENFSGIGSFAVGSGACDYAISNQGAENRTIDVEGVVGSVIKRVKVIITQINPSIAVASWQEVADF